MKTQKSSSDIKVIETAHPGGDAQDIGSILLAAERIHLLYSGTNSWWVYSLDQSQSFLLASIILPLFEAPEEVLPLWSRYKWFQDHGELVKTCDSKKSGTNCFKNPLLRLLSGASISVANVPYLSQVISGMFQMAASSISVVQLAVLLPVFLLKATRTASKSPADAKSNSHIPPLIFA